MSAAYRFLPYVRQAFAAGYTAGDTSSEVLQARRSLPVRLRVNGRADAEAVVDLRPYGPADVSGIDSRMVIRREPPRLSADVEPNYLAHIEFDRPDFPWLFTPAGADSQGRVRPWICLIVVRRREGVTVSLDPGRPLPALTIGPPADPAAELPDLAESWAWAHAQVIEAEPGVSLETLLTERRDLNLSRILCPRRLEAGVQYHACLVPAFNAGRLAGLGLDVPPDEETRLRPAWRSGRQAPDTVLLPVYHHWEFGCGPGGDFESLAARLRGRPLPTGVGVRPIDVSAPGFGLPGLGTVMLEGALKPTGPAAATRASPAERERFETELSNLLAVTDVAPGEDPVVGPPVYGSIHAAQPTVPEPELPPRWLRELNLDPARRAVAGLGALVVRDQQEELMAAAWAQLGQVADVTRMLRRLPFGEAVLGSVLDKRLRPLEPERVLQLTRPMHGRVRTSRQTLLERMRQSRLPEAAASAPFRRALRPRGPVARRVARPAGAAVTARGLFTRLSRRVVTVGAAADPGGLTAQVVQQQVAGVRARVRAAEIAKRPVEAAQRHMLASQALSSYFTASAAVPLPDVPPELDLARVKTDLITAMRPETTLPRRTFARLSAGGAPPAPRRDADLAELARGVPSFPQPMYAGLRDLSQEYLLPGAEAIPPDTVTLLEANGPFVEAFMVGLNHELARELLWREFPGELRHTAFRSFWDTRGAAAAPLPAIHAWDGQQGLGRHVELATGREPLVVLVRGQLLLRFPDAVIQAVEAASPTQLGTEERQPIFRGRLDPDITFVGLNLTREEARGDDGGPGWFLVLQEQPTALRFGLDETRTAERLKSWDDLSWPDVRVAPGGHLKLAAASPPVSGPPKWGFNAAHMAHILRQRPARVAIHAAQILVEEP